MSMQSRLQQNRIVCNDCVLPIPESENYVILVGCHRSLNNCRPTHALNQVTIPDLWQQQAVGALRQGKDVVVQAPTGAGKTLILSFRSNGGKNRGQAIYTVPTRALANDKLAEWRARGWNVGIATGDLAENLDAPILVATLETQKNRLIQEVTARRCSSWTSTK